MPSMTKSPLDFTRLAFESAQKSLQPYSTKFSRHDYTQAQHFALLALRHFMNFDYRKTVQVVREWSDLRTLLELKQVPHWTTLEKAQKRLLKKGLSAESIDGSSNSLVASA
jgi:hypothetical protein